MQLLDDSLSVLPFIVIGARVGVVHPEAHGVVEENGDLARRRGDCLSLANACGQPTLERPQRRVRSPDGDRCQPKV